MSLEDNLTVVNKLSKKEFEIVDLNLKDVVYSSIESGVITYVTEGGHKYYQISTIEEQERYLERRGFRKVERGYLVQMSKVVGFDDERHTLYFENNPGPNAPRAPVSKPHETALRQEGLIVKTTKRDLSIGF